MVISCPPSHLQFYHISHCPSFSWLWTLLHPIWHNLYLKNLPSPFCFYYVWICSYMLCYAKSLQSCPTLSDPMDCSLTGSSVHGIFQARVLEWGAIAFSGISSHGSYLFLFFLHIKHYIDFYLYILDFPGGSDGEESACNAGDLDSIPGSERSPGEGNGYWLQYSCLENSMDRGAWRATVHGVAGVRHDWVTNSFIHFNWTKDEMSFISCIFSPFSHMPLKTGGQGGPSEEPRSWGVRGRLGSPAASPYTAWMWFLLAMGCRLMIHAFLYYSWHTGMSALLFLSILFFSWKQFHKDPLMIHFNHATKICPILSLLFTIILFFPYISSILCNFICSLFFAVSFSFSLILFLVQVPLETSLWFFKFHHFYSSFFIQASLFIASTWGSLVFSLKPVVSGPLSLSTSSYHVIFLHTHPCQPGKIRGLPSPWSFLFCF